MQIRDSARKHGLGDEDIRHAYRNAMRIIEWEYHGRRQLLFLGPARDGTMLELVALPVDAPDRIIHADICRPKFHHYLEGGRRP